MLSNLFWRSARHNQQVNEEQTFPTRVNKEKKKLMLTVLPPPAFKGS